MSAFFFKENRVNSYVTALGTALFPLGALSHPSLCAANHCNIFVKQTYAKRRDNDGLKVRIGKPGG